MSKLLDHPEALCNVMRRIAYEAGEVILDHFDEGMHQPFHEKDDGSPVTDADRLAEQYILAALRDAIPDVPIVAEECMADGNCPDLSQSEYFWLVDPLDGTRDFVTGGKDFTVNIALVKSGAPLFGVIYAPAYGEMFASDGQVGAVRWTEESASDKPIRVRKPSRSGLIVIASKNRDKAEIDAYLEQHKVEKIIRRSSSLKICAVAAGKADLYPNFGQTCEWDTAAGHAILTAAGGDIVTLDGAALSYGHAGRRFINPSFLARSNHLA